MTPDAPKGNCEPLPSNASDGSYGQILKSSSIIGGAQVINLVIGLARVKFVAVLLGPAGVGLLAIYQTMTGLASTIAGLGIQTSGVRDVAKYHSQGDTVAIARTVTTLRRVCWFTGIAGTLLLALLAPYVSRISFGSDAYQWPVVALSITILLSNITGGQRAVIQGTRRIGDLARISVLCATIGSIAAVAIYASLGPAGIVPSLVAMSVISLAVSTYYARRVEITAVSTTWNETWHQSRSLIQFGLAMVFSGVVTSVVAYATRVLIVRDFGLEGAGIFSAAFNLSGIFVQFILGAMGADFYPRLTADSGDHRRMSQLINEQTEVGLLLAFPGLLATLVLAPFAMTVFYTAEFAPAAGMLKWFVLGCIGRVLSWPLGFSLLAKGQGALYVASETAFQMLHLLMIWLGLAAFGLQGVGIAFASLYLVYTLAMLLLTRWTINFSWSHGVRSQISWMAPVALAALLAVLYLPQSAAMPIGIIAIVSSGALCLRQLARRVGESHRLYRMIKTVPGGSYLLRGLAQP